MISTFNRVDALRPVALAQIDEHFAEAINRVIGPLGPLHFLKRQQAMGGGGVLVNEDQQEIIARCMEQDREIASLDLQRRDLKAAVRAATSSAEIKAVLARLV